MWLGLPHFLQAGGSLVFNRTEDKYNLVVNWWVIKIIFDDRLPCEFWHEWLAGVKEFWQFCESNLHIFVSLFCEQLFRIESLTWPISFWLKNDIYNTETNRKILLHSSCRRVTYKTILFSNYLSKFIIQLWSFHRLNTISISISMQFIYHLRELNGISSIRVYLVYWCVIPIKVSKHKNRWDKNYVVEMDSS